MKTLSLTVVLILLFSCGQASNESKAPEQHKEQSSIKTPTPKDGFKAYNTDDYWISYPKDWTLDDKESDGLKFSLFSPLGDVSDVFQENINLATETMPNITITPAYYAESALKMIEVAIPNFKLIKSKGYKGKYGDYHKIMYTGEMSGLQLQWKQIVFVKNSLAYILSFTSTTDSFDEYDAVSEEIMTSFIVK